MSHEGIAAEKPLSQSTEPLDRRWKKLSCLLAIGISIGLQPHLLAGGSIAWNEVAVLLSPPTRTFVERAFVVDETGTGVRLGNQMGSLGGRRIGPYEFEATSKSTGHRFVLEISTVVSVVDASGRPVAMEGAPEGARVVERFVQLGIREPAAVGNHSELPGTKPPLVNKAIEVQTVREIYAEVEKLARQKVNYEFSEGPESLLLTLEKSGGVTRRVVASGGGDHSSSSMEIYFDRQENPRFALVSDSSWRFLGPEKTRDDISEYRLYFTAESVLIESLRKTYHGSSEKEISQARDAAKNVPHAVDHVRATQLVSWLRQLPTLATREKARQQAEGLFSILELIR